MTNFDISNNNSNNTDVELVHSVYTVDESRLRIKAVKRSVGMKACANDDTIECVLFNQSVSSIKESAFENCCELQIVEWTEDGKLIGEVYGKVNKSKSKQKKEPTQQDIKILELSDRFAVQYRAFKYCSKLHTVVFPKNCEEDNEDDEVNKSNEGNEVNEVSEVSEVKEDKNVKNKIVIEKEAFSGCKSLRTVVLLGNGTFDIDDNAFAGCDTDRLVFVVTDGSGAERYAREHGFRWVYGTNI